MMTPATSKDTHTKALVAPVDGEVVSTKLSGPATEATELDSSDLTVLQAVMSQGEPVTTSRLAKVTGLPSGQLCIALEALCELRLLRRLNTLIPSYTARR
jgi:RIO-like serine/threonine protein kinase